MSSPTHSTTHHTQPVPNLFTTTELIQWPLLPSFQPPPPPLPNPPPSYRAPHHYRVNLYTHPYPIPNSIPLSPLDNHPSLRPLFIASIIPFTLLIYCRRLANLRRPPRNPRIPPCRQWRYRLYKLNFRRSVALNHMSSPTTEIAETAMVAVDVPVADTVEKAPRRFPPPCWTQEETLALIEAYRERWYALRRGYLRTADWDAVAAAVASRCPGASPAKTCAQCRHKMEKLRQRYRAEKQRAVSFPYPGGRYLSSWFFFENMEAMENGTTQPTAVKKPENPTDESRLKSFLDQNLLKLKLKSKNTADSSPDSGYDNSSIKSKRSNSLTMIPMDYSTDKLEEDENMNLGRRQQPINAIPKSSFKSKSKLSSKLFNNFDIATGFHHEILPPIKKSTDPTHRRNPNEEFWARIPINNTTISSNFKPKYWDPNSDSRGAIQGLKRERDAVEEIVESIKLLGEGFMRMEKAKMEMAREMEAVRMEMEMKRNEMLLESQKQIVDAFLKGLFEIRKNKKPKSGNVTPNLAEQ